MKIIEKFKDITEEERSNLVTEILIKIENKNQKDYLLYHKYNNEEIIFAC